MAPKDIFDSSAFLSVFHPCTSLKLIQQSTQEPTLPNVPPRATKYTASAYLNTFLFEILLNSLFQNRTLPTPFPTRATSPRAHVLRVPAALSGEAAATRTRRHRRTRERRRGPAGLYGSRPAERAPGSQHRPSLAADGRVRRGGRPAQWPPAECARPAGLGPLAQHAAPGAQWEKSSPGHARGRRARPRGKAPPRPARSSRRLAGRTGRRFRSCDGIRCSLNPRGRKRIAN